jgi:hypothetical protein
MNKKKIWTKGHVIKEFKVFPENRGGNFLDIGLQLGYIKYYEDIIDPALHVEISVVDALGIINKLPVRSGSAVLLKYEHPSQDGEVKLELVISNIIGHTIDNKKEIYTLVCETKTALSNETTRVTKKYTGSISDTVKDIVKLIGAEVTVDATANDSEFFGNFRRPFKCIADLCRKSIPTTVAKGGANSGSAGFLFFETLDGYQFKSIDSLFAGKPQKDSYKMTPYKQGLSGDNNFMLASEPNFKESHDIIKKMRAGSYSTANWYYDIITRKVHFHNFKYNSSVEKANEEDVTPKDYRDFYSRIILGTIDQGTTTTPAEGTELATPQDQARTQAQASARYSALFSQMLDITVPMNLSLRAGMMLKIDFPNINTDRSLAKNSPESGNYMIARLSHELGNPDGDFTGLTLVRDSFTIHE